MIETLSMHPLPWRVSYYRRCKEWHEKSGPCIVDADGDSVAEMRQYAGHPGAYDELADRMAHLIVDSVNAQKGATVSEPTKYSLDDLADIVRGEGIGYAIEHYVAAENIADPAMRAAWTEAERAIKAVRDLLPSDEEDE